MRIFFKKSGHFSIFIRDTSIFPKKRERRYVRDYGTAARKPAGVVKITLLRQKEEHGSTVSMRMQGMDRQTTAGVDKPKRSRRKPSL
ncbi:MAG TPA: hypothetical protein VFN35_04015, partial [Ktedonobacteraceae bacterium]|nr:hypothetical protein [Ktedonobacteraceae bacterium]